MTIRYLEETLVRAMTTCRIAHSERKTRPGRSQSDAAPAVRRRWAAIAGTVAGARATTGSPNVALDRLDRALAIQPGTTQFLSLKGLRARQGRPPETRH